MGNRKRAAPARAAPKATGDRGEEAFDLWLKRRLHALYDRYAREPVPDELLRLIEADRAKPTKPPKQ